MIKRELNKHRHQDIVQEQDWVDGSPEESQQLCSTVQQGQEEGHLPSAQPQNLVHGQQPQGLDTMHVQLQRQADQGSMAPNVEPQQVDKGWEAPEVTVQVMPQKLSKAWEAPEVTVQVRPQNMSPRWEMPEVIVQVQLDKHGRGTALPQVTVQVRPQGWGKRVAGLKVSVQMHLGCGPEGVTCIRGQSEETENGEQQTLKQNQRESIARPEGEREQAMVEQAMVELVPQGAHSQKQDQEGEVIKLEHEQSQEGERAETTEMHIGNKVGLHGMMTEDQLHDQNQEQEEMKADLLPKKEDQRDTEMRQEQSDVQEVPKGLVEEQQEELAQEVLKKRPRETPNYFVSIPITDDQILDRIEDVQELIFTEEPDLLRAFLPVQTMHLTLIVAHLGTEEEVKKAVLALKKSKTKVEAILQGKDLVMTFHGIGQFNNQVIYVKMSEESHKKLFRIAETVEECFNEMNLNTSGSKDFKPHLTFLKLSKAPRLRRRGFRKISSDLYKEYEDSYFGTEVFSQIDLCAMRKKKQESGYYYCECSIHVGPRGAEENKEQEMQTDVGATTSEAPPSSAAGAETGAIAACCDLALHSAAADDKQSENIAEHLIASKEREINEVNGQPEAMDETSPAADEGCSKSVPGLVPARSDALLSVEEGQEKANVIDDSLQNTGAMEYAPDVPTSSG